MKTNSLRERLALGTAMAGVMLTGYGRALAGTCNTANPIVCTGSANTATDVTQAINFTTSTTANTAMGFGIDTSMSGGAAISLTNYGRFVDANSSTITGATFGIVGVNNTPIAGLKITTTGVVTGKSGDGINLTLGAMNSGTGGVYAATVTGSHSGVIAQANGSGTIVITTTGQVTGSGADGIFANLNGANGDVHVTAAGVSGATNGIRAFVNGFGVVAVTSSGAVVGGTMNGIYAADNFNSRGATVNAASVSGGLSGIRALGLNTIYGTTVSATGAITGTNAAGLFVRNHGYGLTITAAQVTGGREGIYAQNYRSGVLSVTTTGPVTSTGTRFAGVLASNQNAAARDVIVSTAAVTANGAGIQAYNKGNRLTQVTASGTVTGGAMDDAIHVTNTAMAQGGLIIGAASVSGGLNGVYASNKGVGAT